jgi:membrane carboxypeptidase/penicillin-binding protein
VEDVSGRVLEEHIITGERVLNESITYQLVDMMAGVIDEGTGRVVRRMGFALPAAGKTGTTNDYNDAWFTGFTPNLSTSVWVGFDRGQGMRDKNGAGITGGRGAAPIWAQFMKAATQGEPPRAFMAPSDIYFQESESGNRVGGRLLDAQIRFRLPCERKTADSGAIRRRMLSGRMASSANALMHCG